MAVVAICSAKGGVGKTTIAANLGYALAKHFLQKTLVVDANPTTASLSLHFGLTSFPVKFLDMLAREADQLTYPFEAGLEVLPAPLNMDLTNMRPRNMVWLRKLEHDFVIIDTAPGIERETWMAMKPADSILVVTTPDLPSVTGVVKTVALAEKLGKEIAGIVVNMVQHKHAELTESEIRAILGYDVICQLPHQRGMAEWVILGQPIISKRPCCAFSQGIKKLASCLTGIEYRPGLIEQVRAVLGF